MTSRDFEDKVLSLSARIYPMVARMLGKTESAEDAVQEIMIKLWGRRKKFADHVNITGYVFLTARNYCLDILKQKRPIVESSDIQLNALRSDLGQNQVEWKELQSIVEKLLIELPTQQSEVLKMRDIDGLEFVEIAAVMNLKVEHVRVLLSRARKQMAAKLKKIYHYE